MVSQNIGNGTGMLYATDLTATKIISCTRNDAEGVRNMRTLGAGSAPIAAERSAVATVTFTAVGGAGNITAVTIAAVNQIGGNVAATVGDPTQTATDVAAAINSYRPWSGVDFTANSIGAVLYIYSTPSAGQATNGQVVTVSVSNAAITTTKTAFAGGSSETGNTDSSVGLRFYLDPKGNASRTSFASAEEITKYIVVRGLQTGIVTKTLAVNTGRLTGIDRSCAITQIFTDTESSAATDELDFIETVDFVEGDSIRLTQYVSGRVVTVTDAATSAGNIYLTNQLPFNCEDNKSIELRLQYDSTLGLIWIENGRSTNQGYITLSRVEARALATTGAIIIGQTYNVYDVGDDGIVLTGITANLYSFDGEYIAVLPDYQNTSGDFEATWNAILGTATIGKLYAYNGVMWESLTGSIGTAPNTDAVNWQLVPKTDPRYVREIDFVQYDIVSNKVIRRTDKRSNLMVGDISVSSFKWGSDAFFANTIINTSNNWIQNSLGTLHNTYIACGTCSADSNLLSMDSCNLVGSGVSFTNTSAGFNPLTGWNVSNKLPATFDMSKIYVHNNFESVVTITDTHSDLMATAPTITGNVMTLDSTYNYIGTLIVNQTGSSITKLKVDSYSIIPFKKFKIVPSGGTTVGITSTAIASALADGYILSTAATTITLEAVNTFGAAAYTDFCEISLGYNLYIGFYVWGITNSKIYV
jgi:hypothetical protein